MEPLLYHPFGAPKESLRESYHFPERDPFGTRQGCMKSLARQGARHKTQRNTAGKPATPATKRSGQEAWRASCPNLEYSTPLGSIRMFDIWHITINSPYSAEKSLHKKPFPSQESGSLRTGRQILKISPDSRSPWVRQAS